MLQVLKLSKKKMTAAFGVNFKQRPPARVALLAS